MRATGEPNDQKGSSEAPADASETSFETPTSDETKRHVAIALRGTLSAVDAEQLREATRALRTLTETQANELDRRLEHYRKDHDPGVPWEDVLTGMEESSE